MSDVTAGEEGADAAASKKPSKRMLMIGGGIAAVLLLGGAGAYLMMAGGEKKTEEHHSAAPVKPAPVFYTLPEMMVNLSASDQRTRYLKLKVSLEVADAHVVAALEPSVPRVVDAFQSYLRELRASDLEGSASLYRLREELTRRVNIAIAPKQIEDVLFQEVLVQ